MTNIKNPVSFEPTLDPIKYTVYTKNGFMIEQSSDKLKNLFIENTIPGSFNAN